MNITRHNYEEFFMLYIDNELSAADRREVDAFVESNPDLAQELVMLQQTILSPDEPIVFNGKADLFRKEDLTALVNETNYEEYFVLYGDNELTNQEKDLVEQFVYRHPQYQEEFELIQQVKYTPESYIVFPDKSSLYRAERDEKVIPLSSAPRWWKLAAAAAVIILAISTTVYIVSNKKDNGTELAGTTETKLPSKNNSAADKSDTPSDKNNTAATENKKPVDEDVSPVAPVTPEKQIQQEQKEQLASTDKSEKKSSPVNGELNKKKIEDATGKEQPKDNFAAVDTKKDPKASNISVPKNVTQERNKDEETLATLDPQVIKPSKSEQSLASNNTSETTPKVNAGSDEKKSIFTPVANDDFEELPTDNKKNKMRGFFRKVTRVFDKATNKDASGNDKDLRIAGFAIALK